ncbi:polysaccharide pyruvyl transferase family protein [Roseicyclus persicicus]|uniref:Polysaccharide pyruvyl transferase family protein n=1 Tax=Roseicyclus persicicus TaxID=2650661 RepID=A0A7X6H2R3_9RHOB|nr:polysaccharide pyruvyl transferase family protein [Roseibacterium persicicum]NKX46088.1 polysaccharide pyruvyl transferase family protein [Roseibacterium persicicum]
MRDAATPAEPLKLHHWGAPNFGDTLSRLVVERVSGRRVVVVGPRQAELFAIGSLMHVAAKHFAVPRPGPRPILWGTGLLNPIFRREFLDNLDIRILRGPVGAAICRVPMRAFGDPGLFAPEAIGPVPARADRVAVVPHHSQMADPAIAAMVARDPRLHLVDPRGAPEAVCAAIASSAHVVSASLHGLVVADAYGVPSTWMDPAEQGRMKYLDYAASIGRPLLHPVAIDEVPALAPRAPTGPLPYAEGIARAREALLTHFPAELRAGAAMTVA